MTQIHLSTNIHRQHCTTSDISVFAAQLLFTCEHSLNMALPPDLITVNIHDSQQLKSLDKLMFCVCAPSTGAILSGCKFDSDLSRVINI